MVDTGTDKDVRRTVERTGHSGWARIGDDRCTRQMWYILGDRDDRVETG